MSDLTPPTRTDPRKRDQGLEMTWDAEMGIEIGIQQFMVLRDGQELAKVPETAVGKFGRALVQSMTDHDTRDQPLTLMPHVDARPRQARNTPTPSSAVNSVRLKSGLSADSPAQK